MRQQQQQENETVIPQAISRAQTEPKAENAFKNGGEETNEQFAAEQAAEFNVALTRQVYEQRRRRRRIAASTLGFILVMSPVTMWAVSPVATFVGNLLGANVWRGFLVSPLWLIANLLVVFAFCSSLIFFGTKSRRKARKAVDALKTTADVKSVGPLVDALSLDDLSAREKARQMLIDLLPRLQPEDSALLNASQRAKLCNILTIPVENVLYKDVTAIFKPAHDRAAMIRVAILQAFAQVGDEHALAIVARLAEMETKTDGERRVRDAAVSCLPLLQARVEQLRAPNTLLRASSAEYTNPEILLRPAEHGAATAADQLLRAATTEL
jgi:hypothetical protein